MSKRKTTKEKRTAGFKLGLVQAIIYLLTAVGLLGAGMVLEIEEFKIYTEYKSSFINSIGNTEIDWNNDGEYWYQYSDDDRRAKLEAVLYIEQRYPSEPNKINAYVEKFVRAIEDESWAGHYDFEYEYYDFVSEDMGNKVWVFENRETGEEVSINFSQVNGYSYYLKYIDTWYDTATIRYGTIPMFLTGTIMVMFTAMQFVAAFKGNKSYHANNIGIAVNTIIFGYGALGLIGSALDRKSALTNDEKYVARQNEKARKRLEREEREKALNDGSTFNGGAFANAGINLLTRFVCLITLGLAYPAMACWKLRWKCRHTYVSGRQLIFDGKAVQFFGKYLLWLLLSVITFGIYYIVCMKVSVAKWQTKHTHFADTVMDKDGENLSEFDGHWYQLLGVNWLCNFVTVITLSFGRYWAHCYKERWFCKHKKIDGASLKFDGKAVQYFGKKFVWTLLTVITLGIYAFWLAVKTEKWTCSHTKIKENEN